MSSCVGSSLSDAQKARIERNRQHALLLRQARLANHPYINTENTVSRLAGTKLIDTGAGFLLEEEEFKTKDTVNILHPSPPVIPPEVHICTECQTQFEDSVLLSQFDLMICNNCRDEEDKHSYITKSEAKAEFLLKDVDLEKREPPLKYILRKNPHNPRWGDMKLFLRMQVFKRAMEVWGSEEEIEEARAQREENREKIKQKKFKKTLKELRMAVRSSTYTKNISEHVHSYGTETYNEREDTYTKTCETCGHSVTYEKM